LGKKHRVLLVDDHPPVMFGTKWMLEQEEDFEVTVASPQDNLVELAAGGAFDVMLFDLVMPGISGMELSRRVLELRPDSTILIYSGFDITPHFRRLIELGIVGFVSKMASRERLVQAVRSALNKEAIVPVALLRALFRDGGGPGLKDGGARLTDREIVILREVARGKSNKLIAEQMHMSQRSLEYVLTQVFHKLSVHSRVEAVNKARSLGLLLDEDLIHYR
jgi:two-component system competent response regulator ComA